MLCQGAHPTLFLSDVVMVIVWTSLEGKPASLSLLGSLSGVRNVASWRGPGGGETPNKSKDG